ncbi:FAD-dependent oxidoreductase, partial [Deinococcus sp. 12RED42]|nr:FAD-dependent oxidoreductase [Deinococcus sp. 12RED42]
YGRAPHGLTGSLRPGWTLPHARNLAQVGGTVHPGGGVPLSILSGWNGAGQLLGLPFDDLDGRQVPGMTGSTADTWDDLTGPEF